MGKVDGWKQCRIGKACVNKRGGRYGSIQADIDIAAACCQCHGLSTNGIVIDSCASQRHTGRLLFMK